MTTRLTVVHWATVAIAAIVGAVVFAVLGLIAGATFGGNFCNTCEFNGLRGYEASGQLGFLIGACAGAGLFGWTCAVVLWNARSAEKASVAAFLNASYRDGPASSSGVAKSRPRAGE